MNPPAFSEPHRREQSDVATVFRSLASGSDPAFITAHGSVSWAEWLESVEDRVRDCSALRRTRVGLRMQPSEKAYACLLALWLLDADLFLLDSQATDEELAEITASHRLIQTIDPDRDGVELAPGRTSFDPGPTQSPEYRLTIFTSGSSGRPKPVCHNWNSLTRTVRKSRTASPQRWLLTYRPHLYAGLQVFLHCLLNQDTLVIPERGIAVDELLTFARDARVSAVSATPSYWRRLLSLGNRRTLTEVPLEQITLGGEIADQPVLDALKQTFPAARLVHIYATSELGRCFSVKDGIAGFPACNLEAPSDEGVELRVEAGELQVRSVNATNSIEPEVESRPPGLEWRATGDQVERTGDRYYFVGRRSDQINVGGNKVQPLRVEQVIQAVAGVRDVRVFARRSSLVGEIVACEFVAEPGFEPGEVKERIQQTCRESLHDAARPRFIESVSLISLSSAGKKCRSS
jgi:acyl-CoA synthetase (AMP-forming)/AMP-acid ligase II